MQFIVSAILGGGGSSSGSSVATSSVAVSTGYLQTLSQPELEKIGLKAVAAGAKPGDLQQAFVTAQTQGDWSKLETLISNALGPDAIKDPNANNPISGISNLIGNFIGKKYCYSFLLYFNGRIYIPKNVILI